MKRLLISVLALLLLVAAAGCSGGGAFSSATAGASDSKDLSYAFKFEDVNGIVHSLSDYKGKPVYIKIWGTWCGVCMNYLPDFEKFASEPHDFVVLSVVFPSISGEKSKEDFIEWYKSLGYTDLTVLLDEKGQILSDFGVTAFPSQIMFDAQGSAVAGRAGEISDEDIETIMARIADVTLN